MLKANRTNSIKAGVAMYDGEGDSWYNSSYNETPNDKNKYKNDPVVNHNIYATAGKRKK